MSKKLVIVESPAKAKTIKKYLGKDYEVRASYGHVRDLIPKEGAVEPEHQFRMNYQVIDKNTKHVDAIGKALEKSNALILATDPDREGEAISWHLYELLRERGQLDDRPVHRVVFHEITQRAIQEAIEHPRGLSMELVNAQQARRALDYLVGFNLSPLLWKKVSPGLSAGRVQSPALRLIVEREEAIEAFEPQEYWTLEADTAKAEQPITAKLSVYAGEKVEQFTFTDAETSHTARDTLWDQAQGVLTVHSVEKKQRRRNPAPPFITSTLQQEAARKLGFTAQRTMRVAQQLYEGVDIGSGAVGLITYMRTDSVSLAQEAVEEIRTLITERYGAELRPDKPRQFKTKTKNAQEAHEAIRPTSAQRVPEELKPALNEDQFKLYSLIWKRAIACQMIHATLDTVAVEFACGSPDYRFRATGSTIRNPGFMKVYQEDQDDRPAHEGDERRLPALRQGETVSLDAIRAEQHFTEPPPRYSEASLVRTLEEYGIGRPSTYASIISTLQTRGYVEMDRGRFIPTDVGRIVNRFLTKHFATYVDYDFTARLEDKLDSVSRGEESWVPLVRSFWEPFKQQVDDKDKHVTRQEVAEARALGTDPKSGRPVTVRMGRYGPFAQIGTKDDTEKPRFASLRPGQRMDHLSLDDALELFKLPRDLGETAEGEPVVTNIGRFGPYVKFGNRYVSLKDDDPYTITRERALELIEAKKEDDRRRFIKEFTEPGLRVLHGRYGPYVTDGSKNAKIPKDKDPQALTQEECEALLAAAPAKKGRGKAGGGNKTGNSKTGTSKTGHSTTNNSKSSGKSSSKGKRNAGSTAN